MMNEEGIGREGVFQKGGLYGLHLRDCQIPLEALDGNMGAEVLPVVFLVLIEGLPPQKLVRDIPKLLQKACGILHIDPKVLLVVSGASIKPQSTQLSWDGRRQCHGVKDTHNRGQFFLRHMPNIPNGHMEILHSGIKLNFRRVAF